MQNRVRGFLPQGEPEKSARVFFSQSAAEMLIRGREIRKILAELHPLKRDFGAFAVSGQKRAVGVENYEIVARRKGRKVREMVDAIEPCGIWKALANLEFPIQLNLNLAALTACK